MRCESMDKAHVEDANEDIRGVFEVGGVLSEPNKVETSREASKPLEAEKGIENGIENVMEREKVVKT